MSIRGVLCVSCLTGVGLACAADVDSQLVPEERKWFSGGVLGEFATGYLASSGSLIDTRPVTSQELDWKVDLGEYGWFDGYGWTISSLHDAQHDLHREVFQEFEGAVCYGYLLETSEKTAVKSSVGWLCNPQIGYYDDHANYWGVLVIQSFENPWLTPYYNLLWLTQPKMRGRIRLGVRHAFRLTETISLMPSVEVVWSDYRRFTAKYGDEPDGFSFLGGGFASERAELKLNWQATKDLAFYVKVQQYMLVDEKAREAVAARSEYYARLDHVIGKFGVEYTF